VVALIAGEPSAFALWTLFKLSNGPWTLQVVQAAGRGNFSKLRRLRRLIKNNGVFNTASRVVASRLIGVPEERRQVRLLDRLLDGAHLRKWWRTSGLPVHQVPSLNHSDTQWLLSQIRPDILVRVTGGILRPEVFTLAKRAALNIHHGQASRIRGIWSIPWGIVEGRRDWVGATVHVIDSGIDTGRILWQGAPQIAPGDSGPDLFFRAHLEAVDGLVSVLREYLGGGERASWPVDRSERSHYRTAPTLRIWVKYFALGRGKRAQVVLRTALEC